LTKLSGPAASIGISSTPRTSGACPRHRSFDGIPTRTSAEARRLKERLDHATESYATTIVTVEELTRGWLAAIHRIQDPHRQINAYAKLQQLFRFFAICNSLESNETAVAEYDSLKRAKVGIGTMDLKIASIALAGKATRPTRNRSEPTVIIFTG
jgi:tRNA(fMet)-specific endonuclease VapC